LRDLGVPIARCLEGDGHLLEYVRGLELRVGKPRLPSVPVRLVESHLDVVLGDLFAQHDDLASAGDCGRAAAQPGDGQLVALAVNRGGYDGVQGHFGVTHRDEGLVAKAQLVPVDLVDLVFVIEFG